MVLGRESLQSLLLSAHQHLSSNAGAQCSADNVEKAWQMRFVRADTAESQSHEKYKPNTHYLWCAGIS